MRFLVCSPNYSKKWNCVHEVFKQDLFKEQDAVFFGPGYPLWEDNKKYSALQLMQQFSADILFVFHSKYVRHWLTDIEFVKTSVCYQVDYYPERLNEQWRNDYIIFNKFNLTVFPNRFMIDQFRKMNEGRKIPLTLYLPFGINPDLVASLENEIERDIDISCIMSINKNEYPNRQIIFDTLRKSRIPNAFLHKLTQSSEALPLEVYINTLQRTKIAVHSCDKYRSTALKCFEVLGCRALLLTDTATDFDYLGFKDGTNYISYDVGQLKSLPKQIERILLDKERLQLIANNGLEFVVRNHTNKHRALKLWSFIKGAL
jgi:hypothetical protein